MVLHILTTGLYLTLLNHTRTLLRLYLTPLAIQFNLLGSTVVHFILLHPIMDLMFY